MEGLTEIDGVKVKDAELRHRLSGWGKTKESHDWYRSLIANGTVGLAYTSDGTAWTCTGIGTAKETNIEISSHICGLPVNVGEQSFKSNKAITGVVVPKGVINNQAFYYASNLTSVVLGEGVTSIGATAFCGCSKLASITIPDSVTSIGGSAFYDCAGLESVTIGNGLTSIGAQAFRGCLSINSINIPDNVTTIGTSTFLGCTSMQNATIGSGVEMINTNLFTNCRKLTAVTFSGNITTIQAFAFENCTSLKQIDLSNCASAPTLAATAFSNASSDFQIKVPSDKLTEWQNATNWSAIASKLVTKFTNEV